jgi:hypothetical protein
MKSEILRNSVHPLVPPGQEHLYPNLAKPHTLSPTRDEAVKALSVIAESVEELMNGEESWTVEQLCARLRFIQRYAHEVLGD